MTFLALPGPTQLWIIALIVLLLFGARKLPALARAMGSSINQFKRGLKEPESDADTDAAEVHTEATPPRRLDGDPAPRAGQEAPVRERGHA